MKYSLRSLMIVVTLVAVCLAGWGSHRKFCLERSARHEYLSIPNVGANMVAAVERTKRHRRLTEQYRSAVWQPWLRFWIVDEEKAP